MRVSSSSKKSLAVWALYVFALSSAKNINFRPFHETTSCSFQGPYSYSDVCVSTCLRYDVLDAYVRLLQSFVGPVLCLRTIIWNHSYLILLIVFLQKKIFTTWIWLRSLWTLILSKFWGGLGRFIAQRNISSRKRQDSKYELSDKYTLLPQIFIDTLTHSMRAHCETCIAMHGSIRCTFRCTFYIRWTFSRHK